MNLQQHSDLQSLQAQSTGEDSNSSDTVASDAGDDVMNGAIDHSRQTSFANSFLSLQNLPGLLPGPSGMPDNFGESQNLPLQFIFLLRILLTTKRTSQKNSEETISFLSFFLSCSLKERRRRKEKWKFMHLMKR